MRRQSGGWSPWLDRADVMPRLLVAISLVLAAQACTARQVVSTPDPLPTFMMGEFIDDYGIRYSIRADRWIQHPGARYRPRAVYVSDRVLVAQNDSDNPGDGNLWTRIDWLTLDETSEYEWAFCYAVYQAETPEDALALAPTQRDTPRTGCNGFPFSRMKRVSERRGSAYDTRPGKR